MGSYAAYQKEPEGPVEVTSKSVVNAVKSVEAIDIELADCEEDWSSKYIRTDYTSNFHEEQSNASLIATDIPQSKVGYYDITFQFDEGSFKCIMGIPNGVGGNNYICWYGNALHEGHGGNVIDRDPNIIGHKYRMIGKPGNNQSVAYRDGEFLKNYTSSFFLDNPTKVQILGMSGYSGGKMTIFQVEFRESENGKVVGKFIPCIRKSDSKAGYYDMVSKKFYGPSSGSFYPSSKEYHYDYQKYRMHAAKPISEIDFELADVDEAWASKYIRVDYIRNDSTAYINTGIYPYAKDFKIEVKGIQQQSRSLFGTNGTGSGVNEIHFTGNNISFFRYCSGTQLGGFNYLSGEHVFTLDTGRFYVDGVEKLPSADPEAIPEGTSTLPLFLFSRNKDGVSEDYGRHTIYYCKIWNRGELVRDYIPCIRRSGYKAGLYDMVSKTFFSSANSILFTPSTKQYEYDYIKY